MTIIREYSPELDASVVRTCFVELQEAEREVEPELPHGEAVVDAYLTEMFKGCEKWNGQVFVAEHGNATVGFVCVYARMTIADPDEAQKEFAYISDIAVLQQYRGRGIGRDLMARAEQYARQSGATTLRLVVLSRNTGAKQLYSTLGFRDRWVQMTKKLA